MRYTRERISMIAGRSGFRPEHVEKVLCLMDLLEGLMRHPFLEGKLALKGGTALNLFYHPLPRLSVDIDLNYIGSQDRETMMIEKPSIEKAVEGVCQRLGLSVRRKPEEHSGGKWLLKYPSAVTPGGNLELDLNYMLRVPLWAARRVSSVSLDDRRCPDVLVLDLHEVAAGKLAALFARSAPRDVFDAANLLGDPRLDRAKLRLGFIIYGAMSRRDWRGIHVEDISCGEDQLGNEVKVLMRSNGEGMIPAGNLARKCRALVEEMLLPMREKELEFIRMVNEEGILKPELLTPDEEFQDRIRAQPALQWKAQNVRMHRGLTDAGA